MVRTVDVGISNWSDNTEGTRNTSCVGRDSIADNKSQGLRKLLTGFCIGQAIVVAAFVIVLAIFVNSNVRNRFQYFPFLVFI